MKFAGGGGSNISPRSCDILYTKTSLGASIKKSLLQNILQRPSSKVKGIASCGGLLMVRWNSGAARVGIAPVPVEVLVVYPNSLPFF